MKQKSEKVKIKKIRKITGGRGCLNIHSNFNNSIITIARESGEKLAQISSRTATGYRGTKKSTSYAVQKAAEVALAKINEFGISTVIIKIRGVGGG